MELKEVLTDIIIPLVAVFIGGGIGSIIIVNHKFKLIDLTYKDNKKINNKHATYQNIKEVYNGNKNR